MDFFKHDINASQDDKICDLLASAGYEMLGYYWRFVEYLYSRGGYVEEKKLPTIAWALHMDENKLKNLVYNFDLFQIDGTLVYSIRVCEELDIFEKNREKMSNLGKTGAEARAKKREAEAQAYAKAHGKRTVKRTVSEGLTKENKENKENNSSVPNNVNNIYKTDDNDDASIPSFCKPSFEEVQQYCAERGGKVDARRFFDYYSGRGWKTGTVPIEDWRAVCRQWEEPKPERKADDSKPAAGQKTNCDQRQYSDEFFESLYK